MLGIPNEGRLLGYGVSTCATCDGFFFRGHNIAVVGGGDSALEEANFLTRFAEKVTLVHRRDQLRASKIMQERAKANPKIEFRWNTVVTDIVGDTKVSGLKVRDTVTGDESELDATGLFVAIGHEPNSSLLKGQLELADNGYVKTFDGSTRTSVDGVFACGDVQDDYYRQAITSAGSGCMAAIDAERWLESQGRVVRAAPRSDPSEPVRPGTRSTPSSVGQVDQGDAMSEKIETLTDATFDEHVKSSDVPVLVDFWAEWCGPCKMISPVLEEIAEEQAGKIRIVKLNIDDNLDVTRRFEVMSIPTLILFKDGEPQVRLIGAKPKGALLEEISAYL